jgi:peptidoglycan/LPS O-acetylase OafA/YrhL
LLQTSEAAPYLEFLRAHWASRLEIGPLLVPWLILVTFIGVFLSRFWRSRLSNRWVAIAGGMCYTTYLYHEWIYRPIGRGLARIGEIPSLWVHFLVEIVLVFPAVFAVSAVLFVLFEKPFMYRDWPNRLMSIVRDLLASGRNRRAVQGVSKDTQGVEAD